MFRLYKELYYIILEARKIQECLIVRKLILSILSLLTKWYQSQVQSIKRDLPRRRKGRRKREKKKKERCRKKRKFLVSLDFCFKEN
jgi:hypothetical protein